MNQNENFLYNWGNALCKTSDGAYMVVTRLAENMKSEGFNAGEAADVLVADNYDVNIVDSVLKDIYASEKPTKERTEEVNSFRRVSFVVPTSYADVKPFIENTLKECSAREFMERLARTKYPIISNLPETKFESFIRVAQRAKSDDCALAILHNDLLPFIENTMYEAVSLAESVNDKATVTASKENENYRVAYSIKESNEVSLSKGACDCEKYAKGHYADFGLACEHLVSAAAVISPKHKLVRGEV